MTTWRPGDGVPPPPAPPSHKAWEKHRDAARLANREERLEDAAAAVRAAIADARTEGEPAATLAELFNALADLLRRNGLLGEALVAAREGLAERRRAQASGVLVGNDLMMLAQILTATGATPEALAAAREAHAMVVATYGAEHGELRYIESFIARQLVGE